MKPEIRFHIRDHDHRTELGIGPGKVALLEAITQTGSITAAAKKLKMSYRRAWLLVDETNRCVVFCDRRWKPRLEARRAAARS
jgi:molybdate transport system regulatory protein